MVIISEYTLTYKVDYGTLICIRAAHSSPAQLIHRHSLYLIFFILFYIFLLILKIIRNQIFLIILILILIIGIRLFLLLFLCLDNSEMTDHLPVKKRALQGSKSGCAQNVGSYSTPTLCTPPLFCRIGNTRNV